MEIEDDWRHYCDMCEVEPTYGDESYCEKCKAEYLAEMIWRSDRDE